MLNTENSNKFELSRRLYPLVFLALMVGGFGCLSKPSGRQTQICDHAKNSNVIKRTISPYYDPKRVILVHYIVLEKKDGPKLKKLLNYLKLKFAVVPNFSSDQLAQILYKELKVDKLICPVEIASTAVGEKWGNLEVGEPAIQLFSTPRHGERNGRIELIMDKNGNVIYEVNWDKEQFGNPPRKN